MIMNPSSKIPQPVTCPSQNPNVTHNSSADLPTALSSLKTLLSVCHQTLHNSNLPLPKPKNDHVVHCPYNPHHRMPAEFLFRHILRCPSPISIEPPNYQNTLDASSSLLHQKTRFTIYDVNQDLCFSLEEYLPDIGAAGFFYRDCPGVVSSSNVDCTKRTFTLPGVLALECSNVVNCSKAEDKEGIDGFHEEGFRILGSDLWFMRRETEGWSNYECVNMYSRNVVLAILGLRDVKESDLKKLLIVSSPQFGIVIDNHMRNHMFVLFSLCLKAIIREALGFMELLKRQVLRKDSNMNFQCPIFSHVLMWLSYQLSVLYGQVNGKLFAVNILKQCVLQSASRMLLFPVEQSLVESFDLEVGDTRDVKAEAVDADNSVKSEANKRVDESINGKAIFVSQVVAAIAALYERSLLEENIRRLRVSQPLPSYQRMVEHTYVSNRAAEERQRRPNYKAIIDHDGLPRQRPSNQETNRTKTREELLAEERDYKRRRMSYRGKKLKRTTLEVMRDIIEEYMNEIKLAGGIGCFEKGNGEEGIMPSVPPVHDCLLDVNDRRNNNSDSLGAASSNANYSRNNSYETYDNRCAKDYLPIEYEHSTQSRDRHQEHLEDRRSSVDREKNRRHNKPPYRRRNSRTVKEDADTSTRPSSGKANHHDYRSHSVSNSHRRNKSHSSGRESPVKNEFEDRYNPSKSHEMDDDDDDVFNGDRYGR